MNKLIALVIILLLAGAVFTNPDEQAHKEKISGILSSAVRSTAIDGVRESEDGWKALGGLLAAGLASNFVDYALDNKLDYNNYLFFSTSSIEFDGEEHTLSVGAFGKVFSISKKEMKEEIEDLLENK